MIAKGARYDPTILRGKRTLLAFFAVCFIFALFYGESWEVQLSYTVILFAALLPSMLWLRKGALGIPVFPVISLVYIPYFAWPLLGRESLEVYTYWEIARAGFTVALFLFAATFAWRMVCGRVYVARSFAYAELDSLSLSRFVIAGLLIGNLFYLGIILQLFGGVGSFFGLIRSIAVTYVVASCVLMGYARAIGVLRGQWWAVSIAGLSAIVLMSWSSLFLVSGLIYLLAFTVGSILVKKRISYVWLVVIFVTLSILHAGKADMRDKYWTYGTNFSTSIRAAQVPGLIVEWFGTGIRNIESGQLGQSLVERAALLHMVLRVQAYTPDRIDYLMGETYAFLPEILVPRFLDADKPASQVAMDLLNIRYGVLTETGVETTAVGWGLIAEAYANFGYLGVIGIALLVGGFCGALLVWSATAPVISAPTLISVAGMMILINIEADFIQLFLTMLQSSVSVFVFLFFFRKSVVVPRVVARV